MVGLSIAAGDAGSGTKVPLFLSRDRNVLKPCGLPIELLDEESLNQVRFGGPFFARGRRRNTCLARVFLARLRVPATVHRGIIGSGTCRRWLSDQCSRSCIKSAQPRWSLSGRQRKACRTFRRDDSSRHGRQPFGELTCRRPTAPVRRARATRPPRPPCFQEHADPHDARPR